MTLVAIMRDENAPHAASGAAAVELLNRGWGKSPQAVAITATYREAVLASIGSPRSLVSHQMLRPIPRLAARWG
jgi:hypothetical protein